MASSLASSSFLSSATSASRSRMRPRRIDDSLCPSSFVARSSLPRIRDIESLCSAHRAWCRHLRWLPSWRLTSNTSANFRVVQMSSLAYPTGFWASPLPRRRPPTSRRGGQIFPTTLRIAEVLLVRRHDGSQRRCLGRLCFGHHEALRNVTGMSGKSTISWFVMHKPYVVCDQSNVFQIF